MKTRYICRCGCGGVVRKNWQIANAAWEEMKQAHESHERLYQERCKVKGCELNHPKNNSCRDGLMCRMAGCRFNHPQIRGPMKVGGIGKGIKHAVSNEKVQIYCIYGILCKVKNHCVYNHPGTMRCRRGDECWLRGCMYNHSRPICKYKYCARKETTHGCPYRHPVRNQEDSDISSESEDESDYDSEWSNESERPVIQERKVTKYKVINKVINNVSSRQKVKNEVDKPCKSEDKTHNDEEKKSRPRLPHKMQRVELPNLLEKLKIFGLVQENETEDFASDVPMGRDFQIFSSDDSQIKLQCEGKDTIMKRLMSNVNSVSPSLFPTMESLTGEFPHRLLRFRRFLCGLPRSFPYGTVRILPAGPMTEWSPFMGNLDDMMTSLN